MVPNGLSNEHGVPYDRVRYRVQLWIDGLNGPEHFDHFGPYDTEDEACAKASTVLDAQTEPEEDDFWLATIDCGELAEERHGPGSSGQEFAAWCPDLSVDHGYSNVQWYPVENYEISYLRERGGPANEWRRRT